MKTNQTEQIGVGVPQGSLRLELPIQELYLADTHYYTVLANINLYI